MYTFKISFDRHKDRYLYREKDFPAEYSVNESTLNYAMDPDWTQKLAIKRLNLKKAFLFATLIFLWVRRRVAMVEEFDRLKRIE